MSKKRSRTDAKSDPRTVAFWAFMAVALVAAVGMYWMTGQKTPPVSNAAPYVSSPAKYEYLKVSILGDSYTKGVGALSAGYAALLSNSLCWDANINGQPGTGYINAGADQSRPYRDRIAAVTETQPALIIVQGSTNDARLNGVGAAATETLTALKAAAPGVPIVMVGPADPPAVDHERTELTRDVLAGVARDVGATFIDPIGLGWLPTADLYTADNLHPNDGGHLQFANGLQAELEKLGLPRLNSCAPVA